MMYGVAVFIAVVLTAFAFRQLMKDVTVRQARERLSAPSVVPRRSPRIQFKRPTSQARYEKSLPIVMDSIARSLYSGSGFLQAVREASQSNTGAVAADLQQVVREVDLGVAVSEALTNWSKRVRRDSVRVCVAAMILAYETGANAGIAVDSASASVRRSLDAAASVKTHATQARASAVVLALLPLAVSGPMILFSESTRHFMLHNVVGVSLLLVGLTLDCCGWLCMRFLVRRALA